MNPVPRYFEGLLIALDQLGTAILGGYPDETLSSYAFRMRSQKKPFGFFADWIDWVALHVFGQKDHCFNACLAERVRAQLPPELR